MHQTLDLSRDCMSVCLPQTAGGHSHKAPAISEVMHLPEATGEAYSFATTVTLYLRKEIREWSLASLPVSDLFYGPVIAVIDKNNRKNKLWKQWATELVKRILSLASDPLFSARRCRQSKKKKNRQMPYYISTISYYIVLYRSIS